MSGRMVRSLLQLSERWPCHVLFVGRMKFGSLDTGFNSFQYLNKWFSLLQLSERRSCRILFVDRMTFASLKANLGAAWGLLVYPIPLFLSLSHS